MRNQSPLDLFLKNGDQVLRGLSGALQRSERPSPGDAHVSPELNEKERKHTAALMRINHTGEVCAQALYQGQALTAKSSKVKTEMKQAAEEEVDHLAWCGQKLSELEDHTSYLNPAWYALSYTIGAVAGVAGDKWSLGFVEETEIQVCKHLDQHLDQIPLKDASTRSVLNQMRTDEERHAKNAHAAGAATLPLGIKRMMTLMSKVMTKSTYYI